MHGRIVCRLPSEALQQHVSLEPMLPMILPFNDPHQDNVEVLHVFLLSFDLEP